MPLLVLGLILCVGLLIYTIVKNKNEISKAGDELGDRLYSLFEKLIKNLNKSSTTFTVEDEEENNSEEKEEDKVLYFPGSDDNSTEE